VLPSIGAPPMGGAHVQPLPDPERAPKSFCSVSAGTPRRAPYAYDVHKGYDGQAALTTSLCRA